MEGKVSIRPTCDCEAEGQTATVTFNGVLGGGAEQSEVKALQESVETLTENVEKISESVSTLSESVETLRGDTSSAIATAREEMSERLNEEVQRLTGLIAERQPTCHCEADIAALGQEIESLKTTVAGMNKIMQLIKETL